MLEGENKAQEVSHISEKSETLVVDSYCGGTMPPDQRQDEVRWVSVHHLRRTYGISEGAFLRRADNVPSVRGKAPNRSVTTLYRETEAVRVISAFKARFSFPVDDLVLASWRAGLYTDEQGEVWVSRAYVRKNYGQSRALKDPNKVRRFRRSGPTGRTAVFYNKTELGKVLGSAWLEASRSLEAPSVELELPRDMNGKVRWNIVSKNTLLFSQALESEAKSFYQTYQGFTKKLLFRHKRYDIANAAAKYYPGGFIKLKEVVIERRDERKIQGVIYNERGGICWKIKGASLEENLSAGIQNIQSIFLASFPDFDRLYPRDTEGLIFKEVQEKAKEFILARIGKFVDFVKLFGKSPTHYRTTPYFKGSFVVALEESFEPWGLRFSARDFAKGRRDRDGIVITSEKVPTDLERLLDI